MSEGLEGGARPKRLSLRLPLQRFGAPLRRRVPDQPHTFHGHTKVERAWRDLEQAVDGLRRGRPELSAGQPIWPWQKSVLTLVLPILAAVATLAPDRFTLFFAAALALPFFCVVVLRTAALCRTLSAKPPEGHGISLLNTALPLPRYSILVPLYDEAAIVPDIVEALLALDYPVDRMEVFLALEENDAATRKAVDAAGLPPHMRAVVVPEGEPRTKPRALNYVLPRTTGDLIVIYDAEDMPEPDQLRRAVRALSANPELGCVQARLNVLNAEENWLTRQFAIEYTVLFDCMLPTLEALRLPVPLGGTSNHFTRSALMDVGAWDPFNVTEDADLGIRLARFGWTVGVVASTTWEEAPENFSSWLKQRTRWLKGWMQTYLVHMRNPARTARDLGWRQFAGLQVLMGGLILSALVHPWFYVVAAAELAAGPLTTLGSSALAHTLWIVTTLNLLLGYATGVALGCVAVVARDRRGLALWALLMPVYWLLISFAAYRAMLQLATQPYRWEKTQHRPRATFLCDGRGGPFTPDRTKRGLRT